jgi:very-short-patch-repair endonuclease
MAEHQSPIELMLFDELRRVIEEAREEVRDSESWTVLARSGAKLAITNDRYVSVSVGGADVRGPAVLGDVRFLGYRLDFLLFDGISALGVECDGFDFHDRTKQQASADRARDREMLRAGLSVVRFTGSDIHRDVNFCALEALSLLFSVRRQRESIRRAAIKHVTEFR